MKRLAKFIAFLAPYGVYSYFIMFGFLLACGFGFPMPEDVILISGGILSSRGICNFWITVAVCMTGVVIGDGTIFAFGRIMGQRVKSSFLFRRVLTENRDKRVAGIFKKYGDKVIFAARFMPGLRMPIFLTAGMYKVSPWKFFILDGFAAMISVPVWIEVGFLFGANLEELERRARKLQLGIYGALGCALVIMIIGVLIKKYLAKKMMVIKNSTDETSGR